MTSVNQEPGAGTVVDCGTRVAQQRNALVGESIRNILVATDFDSMSLRALSFAAAAASRYGATLHIVHVLQGQTYGVVRREMVDRMLAEEKDCAEYKLSQISSQLQLDGRKCEVFTKFGTPVDLIVECAHRIPADLIAVGTSSRGRLGKLFVGSVAEAVIRTAPCPVLTVGPHVVSEPTDPIRMILCPFDFSADSVSAANVAVVLARLNGAHLTFLNVLEGDAKEDALERFLREMSLSQFAATRAKGISTEVLVTTGAVAEQILNAPTTGASSLIVMGVRGTGAFASTSSRFGSTLGAVLSFAPCPVLTVGSIKFESRNEE